MEVNAHLVFLLALLEVGVLLEDVQGDLGVVRLLQAHLCTTSYQKGSLMYDHCMITLHYPDSCG